MQESGLQVVTQTQTLAHAHLDHLSTLTTDPRRVMPTVRIKRCVRELLAPSVDMTEQARREIEQLVDLRVAAVRTVPACVAIEGRRT